MFQVGDTIGHRFSDRTGTVVEANSVNVKIRSGGWSWWIRPVEMEEWEKI